MKSEAKKSKKAYPVSKMKKIRDRAYEIYLERRREDGTPEDDWLQAEDELYSDPGL